MVPRLCNTARESQWVSIGRGNFSCRSYNGEESHFYSTKRHGTLNWKLPSARSKQRSLANFRDIKHQNSPELICKQIFLMIASSQGAATMRHPHGNAVHLPLKRTKRACCACSHGLFLWFEDTSTTCRTGEKACTPVRCTFKSEN